MKKFKAIVRVKRKPGVLDPQGKTILESLQRLEYGNVNSLYVGKSFFIDIDSENAGDAKAEIAEISKKVLSNPIIEDFEILEIEEI
ncbi:MAG: phosphoribosylformylglycinamidine synthase subunit PurS [Candidatus Zixiibacteriota bacterium]